MVGVNPDVAPIKYVDENGKITGLAPQLVEAAAQVMGLKTDMQLTTFDALIPGLDSDRIDVIASIGDFKERQAQASFIDYLNAGTAILGAKGFEKDEVKDLLDLCGARLGYIKGSQQQGQLESAAAKCAAEGKPAMAETGYASSAAAILAVQSGQADGAYLDLPAVAYNVKQHPAVFKNLYTTPKPVVYGVVFSKKDPELQAAFKAALDKLVDNGEYKRLLEAYGVEDLALPELPIDSGGPIAG